MEEVLVLVGLPCNGVLGGEGTWYGNPQKCGCGKGDGAKVDGWRVGHEQSDWVWHPWNTAWLTGLSGDLE